MRIYLFLLLVSMALFSCSEHQKTSESNLAGLFIGYWKYEHTKSDPATSEHAIKFTESTCNLSYPYGNTSKYYISGDTLIIVKENTGLSIGNSKQSKFKTKFLINHIDSNSLILKPIENSESELFIEDAFNTSNSIQLSKIMSQYQWKPDRIAFASSICFGVCPAMHLEIDSAGNFYFVGKAFTKIEGPYYGKLTEEAFNNIITEINCINFDSLQQFYADPSTDLQTQSIAIKCGKTIYMSSVYGYYHEPIELRILLESLEKLYTTVDLTYDSTIFNKLIFQDFEYKFYTPPPVKKK